MPQFESLSDAMELDYNINTEKKQVTDLTLGTLPTHMEMADIGKPYLFRPEIDASGAMAQYLEKKMGIVELVPCSWRYPVIEDGSATVKPKIWFSSAIQHFQSACRRYDLDASYTGLRLHLTDDTTSTDDITNSYDTNMFQSAIDSLRSGFRHFRQIGQIGRLAMSTDSGMRDRVGSVITGAAERLGLSSDDDDEANVQGAAQSVSDMVLMGNKLSFPKIWRDSEYNPNLSINVRLFSPYGHPKAVKKFIIEPLAHLILMCAPRTSDGLSFGHPPTLHVRGHGMVHLAVGYASSISWRRGGEGTNFSLFRQPTTIDVSLSLQTLIGGFGYYDNDDNKPSDESTINKTLEPLGSSVQGNVDVSFPTLGHIFDSLRPFEYHGD